MNIVDRLIENTVRLKNPTVVGLDPDLKQIPFCYKQNTNTMKNPLEQVAEIIFNFNKDVIDVVSPFVPAVKPQIAFYEKYGSFGILSFEKTVQYAKAKGLVVIEDGKRNDIGSTALAYAEAHLGRVDSLNGSKIPAINVDFLTVSPFLGSDSIAPFIDACILNNKGIFVLVKTSNGSSGEIQDAKDASGSTVSHLLAKYLAQKAKLFMGEKQYSSIGAVIGATYPEEAKLLRGIMPANYFLVPGYGTQGAGASDVVSCFNSDGLGAIVNSSRGILYSHMSDSDRKSATRAEYLQSVKLAVQKMQREIYIALKEKYKHMIY